MNIQNEYENHRKKKEKAFKVAENNEFRLHKFSALLLGQQKSPLGSENEMIKISQNDREPAERLMGGPVQDQYFSAYVPGFVSYIKFNAKHKGIKNCLSAERIKHYLSNPGSKRQDMKRTLIGFTKSD